MLQGSSNPMVNSPAGISAGQGTPYVPPVAPPTTTQNAINPDTFKALIVAKYPNGVAKDGTPYTKMDATVLTQKIVNAFPNGVTNAGVKYSDYLPKQPTQQSDNNGTGQSPKAAGVLGNALTQSEQNFGKDIAQAGYLLFGGQKQIDATTQQYIDSGARLTALAKTQTDPAMKAKYAQMAIESYKDAQNVGGSVIGSTRTPAQIVGDALGTTMDIVLSGSLNNEAKSFQLLSSADKASLAAKGIESAKAYDALSTANKLKLIGINTAKATAKGAALGYGVDVSQNLQQGKTGGQALTPGLGTVIGTAAPLVIGGVKISATALMNPENGGRVVNSLIKPLAKDFAYGKNPGQTVAEMGITGNNLDNLGENVKTARMDVGQQLGQMASSIEGKGTVNLSRATQPIDDAIEKAQEFPQTNKALITRLLGVKSDLLNYIGGDGTNLTFAEGINTKGAVGDLTKWTGSASDDAIVNKALKQVYGTVNSAVMDGVTKADPEVAQSMGRLNSQYGNLLSAENAINHRGALLQRQNMITTAGKAIGSVTGVTTSILSGNPIAGILSGIASGVLESALEKATSGPAVKTRLASWLASESPDVINKVYKANPAIRNILIKLKSSTSR